MVVLKPNVVRGGRAIGLGNNLYLMKGRTHSKGGIDIGKNPKTGLEVENNEVMQVSPRGVRVFSAQPILGGISPAQYILGGANPNQVFNAQEQWKKVNRINDDGTKKARFGTEENENNNDKRYTRDEQWRLNNQHKLDFLVNSSKYPIIIGTNLNEEGFVDNHLGRWNGKNRRDSSSIKVDSLMWNGNPKNKIKSLNDEEYRGNFGLDNITKEELDKVGLSDLKDSLVFHKPFDGDSLQTIRKLTPEQAIKIMDAKIDSSFINLENQFGKDSVEIFFKNNPNAKNELGRVLYRMPNKFKTKGYINWLKNNKKENTISNFYNFLLNGKRINTSIEQVRKYIDENATGPRKQDGSFKYGGIHIKPSKRGTFTAAAKKHGMSVQGFARKVLANKGKYSSAMVKKANFARNASKWKHKEFGGDMDFNYWITKDNIYKLGGRKKGQWGLQDYSNSFKVNLQPFNPSPITSTNVNNNLSLGIPNLIGAGLNLAGNVASYFVNRRALKSMQAPVAPSAPTPLRAENLETRVSTAAQEAALRENVAKQENLIAGNLSSSRSRLNAVNAVRNQGIGLYNQLQERKQNVQTELINRAKLNRQQINTQNTLLANQYKDKVTNWKNNVIDFENKRKDALSENVVQHLIQGPIDAIAGERGYFANLENNKRYRITAFLNAIGNPYAVKAMKSGEFLPLAKQFGLTENDLKRFGLM